ncbi:MAG: hypothetical protein K8J08_19655, partial [Thermoanaerobaculia bacterium]|nr:hypothetical protein [Thermoanaerobaculia bacterium]
MTDSLGWATRWLESLAQGFDGLAQGGPAGVAILILGGLLLLLFGRRIFWVALGSLGFLVGWQLAATFAADLESLVFWLVSVAGGLLGVLLAVLAQKLATGISGFALGLLVMGKILPFLPIEGQAWSALAVVVGGIAGSFLALGLFGVVVCVITAGIGAAMLAAAIPLESEAGLLLLFGGLWLVGFVLQV